MKCRCGEELEVLRVVGKKLFLDCMHRWTFDRHDSVEAVYSPVNARPCSTCEKTIDVSVVCSFCSKVECSSCRLHCRALSQSEPEGEKFR